MFLSLQYFLNTSFQFFLHKQRITLFFIEYVKRIHRNSSGHTGKLAGKGFYEYPNPRYLEKDFLK